MKVLRSINTKFWDDPWVTELTSEEKLIWLYLLTNPLTNLIGIYEISLKKIQFDCALESFERVSKALERFQSDKKAFYFHNFIILVNFYKNQSFNSNMIIGARNEFAKLPNELKQYVLSNGLKGFETLSKGLGILPKKEKENENENEINTHTLAQDLKFEILEIFERNGLDLTQGGGENEFEKFISYYKQRNWKTSDGTDITDPILVAKTWTPKINKPTNFQINGKKSSLTEALKSY